MATLALISLLLLAGAGPAAASPKADYICKDGTRLEAEFLGTPTALGSVVLKVAGQRKALTLPQILSADGGRYANDKVEFWIKGQGATLTRDGKSTSCALAGK